MGNLFDRCYEFDQPRPRRKTRKVSIGIDLGTTFSCAAVWQSDRVIICGDEKGNRTTPSHVSFLSSEISEELATFPGKEKGVEMTRAEVSKEINADIRAKSLQDKENGRKILNTGKADNDYSLDLEVERNGFAVGHQANKYVKENPLNTIFDAKRLIGKRFSDATVQADLKMWPFKVVEGPNDTPLVEVMENGVATKKSAIQISSMVLTKMKNNAEMFLGEDCIVDSAVITVPAYFDDAQRQATKDAGAAAGLNVLQLINEPTAAAVAYGLMNSRDATLPKEMKLVLVYDLGGGTLDVTALLIKGTTFQVKATAGDNHLGGRDFDNNLIKHCLKTWKRSADAFSGETMSFLRLQCEQAKISLSDSDQATISIKSGDPNCPDLMTTVTRRQYEKLNNEDFQRCMEPVKQALKDIQKGPEEIRDVVLVGGSTRIPKIRELLKKETKRQELCTSIDPDEAVAHGAAIQAAVVTLQNKPELLSSVYLKDVTPLSLGIEGRGGKMDIVIPRNKSLPATMQRTFTTVHHYQEVVTFKIYEGEHKATEGNRLLGTFDIENLPESPAGALDICVTFHVDENGILTVSAAEMSSGQRREITIKSQRHGNVSNLDVIKAATRGMNSNTTPSSLLAL